MKQEQKWVQTNFTKLSPQGSKIDINPADLSFLAHISFDPFR